MEKNVEFDLKLGAELSDSTSYASSTWQLVMENLGQSHFSHTRRSLPIWTKEAPIGCWSTRIVNIESMAESVYSRVAYVSLKGKSNKINTVGFLDCIGLMLNLEEAV